jgi:hypothetical protein
MLALCPYAEYKPLKGRCTDKRIKAKGKDNRILAGQIGPYKKLG